MERLILITLSVLLSGSAASREVDRSVDVDAMRRDYEKEVERVTTPVTREYTKKLNEKLLQLTKAGALDDALAVRAELRRVEAILQAHEVENASRKLLAEFAGTWKWSTGATTAVDERGLSPGSEPTDLRVFVIDPGERRLLLRSSTKYQYEVVLSRNGNAFEAEAVYAGFRHTGRRIGKS